MQERNVTRAGQRLGLSQPAMSHALTRLRYMLKDDLFIRSPKGMLPTPRAEQLALPVRSALDGLQHSLEPTQFIPSNATRSFRIAADNYSAVVLVGLLVGRIIKIAPGVTLEFRPSGTLNVLDLLDRGELDLAIGAFFSLPAEFVNYGSFESLRRSRAPVARSGSCTSANADRLARVLPPSSLPSPRPCWSCCFSAIFRSGSESRASAWFSTVRIALSSSATRIVALISRYRFARPRLA
jgi:DNA-binding transcriptional LysR family regulator